MYISSALQEKILSEERIEREVRDGEQIYKNSDGDGGRSGYLQLANIYSGHTV